MSLSVINSNFQSIRPSPPLASIASSICSRSAFNTSFPPACPSNPLIPSFPLPAASLLGTSIEESASSLRDKISGLFSDAISPQEISLQDAIRQNLLPAIAYWLQKNDEDLVRHLDPEASPRWALLSKFKDFAKQSAREGNISVVLMLLDRYRTTDTAYGLSRVLEGIFASALETGQRDLIFAVLRKGYPMGEQQLIQAIQQQPRIALELMGEDFPFETLRAGMKAAIVADRPELICPLLDRPEGDKLIPGAALEAAKENKVEILKELFQRGLSDADALETLYHACAGGWIQAAHFLASRGSFYLNEKSVVSTLVKTGFLPSRFSLSMIEGLSPTQTGSLLEAYLRFGTISDQDLIASWPKDKRERFSVFRAILVDRSSLTHPLQEFLAHQLSSFSPTEQELAIRIAILQDRPDSLIDLMLKKASLSKETEGGLASLRTDRIQYWKRVHSLRDTLCQNNDAATPALWNEEEERTLVLQNGSDILDWKTGNQQDPRFIYFESSDIIGQIKGMPNLIFKSFRSRENAESRLALIHQARAACIQKNLTHLRVPNAFLVTALHDREGKAVPVHLVVEEMMPIAGHKFDEVKDLLEVLNQDEKTREIVNGYFRELTSLVCKTGLTDLKPTNVPLLKDGSGLGIIDSNMQGNTVKRSIYAFAQSDHSLIDWLSPQNFDAIGETLQTDSDCPKDINRSHYEKLRQQTYEQEKELKRFHLMEYGNVEAAPIALSGQELARLDPEERTLCSQIVDSINKTLKKTANTAMSRRMVSLREYRFNNQETNNAFDRLKRMGKIKNFEENGGHGTKVQA